MKADSVKLARRRRDAQAAERLGSGQVEALY
jgi:hypothetical protein